MIAVRILSFLGACALSVGIGQSVLADDSKTTAPAGKTATAAHDGPTAEDLKKSKPRGIFLKVPGSPAAFEVEKAAPTAAPAAKSEPAKHTSAPKAAAPAKTAAAQASVSKPVAKEQAAPTKPAVNSTSKPPKSSDAAVKAPGAKVTAQAKQAKPSSTTAITATAHKATQTTKITKATKPAAHVSVASTSAEAGGNDQAQGDAIIKAWLNKSGKQPTYKDGDKMEVNVNTSKDCNLVIYDFDGKGTLTQIFPNEYQKEGTVKAGDTITIGGAGSNFDFQVSLGDGIKRQQERLFIFAYPNKDEAPVSVAMAKVESSPFRSAQMTLEQYRNLVNQSKVYFARSVTVKAKKGPIGTGSNIQTVANELNDGNNAPNKMELSFSVEK